MPVMRRLVTSFAENCVPSDDFGEKLVLDCMIPKGFRMKNGTYEDICPYYHAL